MSLRRRTYPEVLENLLTAMTGGVAGEQHPFPPPGSSAPPLTHQLLQPPVSNVVSVHGTVHGETFEFKNGADYTLVSGNAVQWLPKAQLPDDATIISVNYTRVGSQSSVNDVYVGSVVRTVTESVALEIARLYAQLDAVYQSAFLDSATSGSLDNVVALLGIDRVRGGKAVGEVEFTRASVTGAITIPAGTRISTADGNVEYETTETVTLTPTQTVIRAAVRDLETNDPLPAGALTLLPVPISGISGVTNPAPTALSTAEETDPELRTRARSFLHGSERATLGAIKHAIARQGIKADVEEDATTPGFVKITPHVDNLPPELYQRMITAIDDARPAGVLLRPIVSEAPRRINLDVRLITSAGLVEDALRAAQRTVRERISDYFAKLPAGEVGSINKLVGLTLSVPGVEDVRILSATVLDNGTLKSVLDAKTGQLSIAGFPTVLGELHVADPNLPTRLNVLVTYPKGTAPPDQQAINAALATAVPYINNIAAAEPAEGAAPPSVNLRELSFGRLVQVVPLPGRDPKTLEDVDNASPAPPAPDENQIKPYRVKFVFTQASGFSEVIDQALEKYILAPAERVSLSGLEVREASDG